VAQMEDSPNNLPNLLLNNLEVNNLFFSAPKKAAHWAAFFMYLHIDFQRLPFKLQSLTANQS